MFSTLGLTMMSVVDIMSTLGGGGGGCSVHRGYHEYTGGVQYTRGLS